jgi:hypothetical protein
MSSWTSLLLCWAKAAQDKLMAASKKGILYMVFLEVTGFVLTSFRLGIAR